MYFKIRAWDKERKIMYYPRSLGFVDGELEFIDRNNEKLNEFGNPSDVVLMVSTGLKDKNGKEIFEGDIILCYVDGKQYLAKMLFRGGCFMFKIPRFPWYGGMVDTANFEVVGNIYENPELLEDE